MVAKYVYLLLPGAFPGKFTPDVDAADELVHCDVPVLKIPL